MLKPIKSIIFGSAILSSILLSGCATQMPVGRYYTGIKGNWYTGEKVNNDVEITKEGKACSHSVLAIASFGDGSIAAAQKNGGIKNVASVNYTAKNILGVFGTYCTIVKGN